VDSPLVLTPCCVASVVVVAGEVLLSTGATETVVLDSGSTTAVDELVAGDTTGEVELEIGGCSVVCDISDELEGGETMGELEGDVGELEAGDESVVGEELLDGLPSLDDAGLLGVVVGVLEGELGTLDEAAATASLV
jgi:hypothetical protein